MGTWELVKYGIWRQERKQKKTPKLKKPLEELCDNDREVLKNKEKQA